MCLVIKKNLNEGHHDANNHAKDARCHGGTSVHDSACPTCGDGGLDQHVNQLTRSRVPCPAQNRFSGAGAHIITAHHESLRCTCGTRAVGTGPFANHTSCPAGKLVVHRSISTVEIATRIIGYDVCAGEPAKDKTKARVSYGSGEKSRGRNGTLDTT